MIDFFQGLTMGLAYVAPIGAQNIFVINSALMCPFNRAFLTALIVIFFDVTLAWACFFGIGAVMQAHLVLRMAVLLFGSVIVIRIGLGLLRSTPQSVTGSGNEIPIRKTVVQACVVTWFNPQALIDGTMMLGAFRAALPGDQAFRFIAGVSSASVSWFLGVTLLISAFSNFFSAGVLKVINRICGAVIVFYGCKLMYAFIVLVLNGI